MISITKVAKGAERFVADNSPLILTVMGATGVVATAILAAQAGARSSLILQYEQEQRPSEPMTVKEEVAATWTLWIPTISVAAISVVAIVASNRIGARRATAMATALTISERAFTEYQNKVVERLGENKEREVRDAVQQERMASNPVDGKEVIILGGSQLCYDSYSGRYFESTMEDLKHAINRLNHRIVNDSYASLTDFYTFVGLDRTSVSDEVGWDSTQLFDVYFTTTLSSDGRPAISMEYRVEPVRNYFRSR